MFIDASMMAAAAAASGQGVALGRSALVNDDLITGRLVRPFAASVRHPGDYYIVCPEGHTDRPKIKAFREWLLDEAAAAGSPHDPDEFEASEA
jgi:LysR family transcriptional regulator, glycine cleavage system transcriptional activator